MPTNFNAALVSGDYTNLRGTGTTPAYGGGQYASQCPNTVVFAAQFNSAQSGSVGSFAQEEWHNATVGAYTSALPGQWFLASTTNDMTKAYFTGRVRKSFGATTAYFNETSLAQAGTDYFWVLDTYPVMDKLLRFLIGQNAYKVDYDLDYRPLRPIIGSAADAIGLKSAYAGFIDPISSKFRISISALFYPSENANTSTITAWSLNFLDGTLISGSSSGSGLTTGTITLDFPAGFRNILLSATNSAGTSSTLAIAVWAETRSGSATLITGFNGATITFDVSSASSMSTCNIEVFTPELQSTLNNTLICVWDEEYLNNTLGSVGGNVRYLGRLRKEQNQAKADPNFIHTLGTQYTLEGPDTQLQRLDAIKFTLQSNITPVSWGDIKSMSLYSSIALLLTEFTTFTNAHVLNFDTYDSTFPYPALNTTGSNMLGVLNDLGMSVNAQMQFAGDGRASFVRHAFYLSGAGRNALTTVANWTDLDRTPSLNLQLDEIRTVAQVDAWGGEWIGTPIVVPLHSQAPGLARDIGDKVILFLKQILANAGVAAAQTELNDRAGCHWFKEALQRRLSNLTHPDAYGFMFPDIGAWYTWTISATDNLRGIAYTTATRWILEKISFTHDNKTGSKTVTPTYLQETNGIGFGNTIPIITSNNLPADQQNLALGVYPLLLPTVPPIEMSGPDSAVLKSGIQKLALILSDGTVTYTTNFQQTPPTWTTPVSLGVSGTVLQWIPDFHSGYYAGGGAGSLSFGWIVTTTGVYYGSVNSAPSFVLGHTFAAASSLRSAAASLTQVGHIVVVTDYAGSTVQATYATTGANWTAEASIGAGNGTNPPGCWFSQHTANVVYTSINGTGYKSTDGGATWSSFAGIVPGSDCATDISIPYASTSDSIIYYRDSGVADNLVFNFLTSQAGFQAVATADGCADESGGTWISSSGWSATYFQAGCSCYLNCVENIVSLNTSKTISSVDVEYSSATAGGNLDIRFWSQSVNVNCTGLIQELFVSQLSGTNTHTFTPTGAAVHAAYISLRIIDNGGGAFIRKMTIHYTTAGLRLVKNGTDISPTFGYAPWKSLPQISTSLINGNILAVGAGDSTQTNAGIWVSQNQGGAWTQLVAPTTDGSTGRYDWIPMSGNPTPVLYPAGSKGRIGYSTSLTGPVVDKRGNLSTAASVIGLAGYRN